MSDVFQALLPQGSTLGNVSQVPAGVGGKATLGVAGDAPVVTDAQPETFSFKIAFQNSVASKKPLVTQALPEDLELQTSLPKGPLLAGEQTLQSGESLPLLPLNADAELPLLAEDHSVQQDGADFLFATLDNNEPTLLKGELVQKGDDGASNKGMPNFTVSFRPSPFSATEQVNTGIPLDGSASDTGDNSELAAITFPLNKLMSSLKKEVSSSGAVSLENQPAFSRIGAMSQGLMGGANLSSERLAASNSFNETLTSLDFNVQSKSAEGYANPALVRGHGDFSSAPSIALQSIDNSAGAESLKMSIRFGQPGWAEQLVERAANLAGQNIKQAEVQLNPQELGSINIKISVSQEQAAVTFAAQNAQVREAIDQTLHRLREAFESSGLELVQADVHDQRSGSQGAEDDEQAPTANSSSEGDSADGKMVDVVASPSGIDHFV